jgi:hypothetical protein
VVYKIVPTFEGEDRLNEFSEDFPHLKIPAIQVLETIAI